MLCGINILCFAAGVLLPYEQRVLSRCIMHSDKSVKVGIPAPVNAVIDVIELCYLVVGYLSYEDVIENIATSTICNAHILVLIGSGIGFFEKFGVIKKRLAKPLFRHSKISAFSNESVRSRHFDVLVRPVLSRLWRVERLELICSLAASYNRLFYRSHSFFTAELVKLLKPHDADIAKRRLDRLYLVRVISTTKVYFLPC